MKLIFVYIAMIKNNMKKLLLLLLLTSSFTTFAHSHLDFTLSEFCIEQPNVQHRGTGYYFANEEVGITATSICYYKNAYGQIESKENYINGIRVGKYSEWYKNGQIAMEGYIVNGKQDRKLTRWRENSNKWVEVNYKIGDLHGKHSSW